MLDNRVLSDPQLEILLRDCSFCNDPGGFVVVKLTLVDFFEVMACL